MEDNKTMSNPAQMPNYDAKGIGTVKISEEVVSVIAGIAASEVEGVTDLNPTTTGGITQVFTGKRNVTKGVKVNIGENEATIDMILSVQYGYSIPKVMEQVQQNVAETVYNITGLKVTHVNVLVHNITIKEQETGATDGK